MQQRERARKPNANSVHSETMEARAICAGAKMPFITDRGGKILRRRRRHILRSK